MDGANLRKAIGPGLLYAGAAIGVSHLIQSTRAGADFGFALVWVMVLACVTKYVFMEAGPRYAAATGQSLIEGYRRLGRWALVLFLLATVGTMFTIQAAVTLVTAGLAGSLVSQFFGFQFSSDGGVNSFAWSLVVTAIIFSVLLAGRYGLLDLLMKIIVSLLSFSTVLAVVWSTLHYTPLPNDFVPPDVYGTVGLLFIVALIGWMPTPIDCSVWQSLWSLGRAEQTGHRASWAEARFDFNLGYITASVLALFFLTLGALVMYGRGESFPSTAVGFAKQLIDMYAEAIGTWAVPLITLAALTAMLSTTLTVTDAYPRIGRHLTEVVLAKPKQPHPWLVYGGYLIVVNAVAITIIGLFMLGGRGQFFKTLVDMATALCVLTAPIMAWLNHRVVHSEFMPAEMRPGRTHRVVSWFCLAALCIFAVLYLIAVM